jgi:phosphoribosylformimino-5-aminoimidazole carboxamide ribotide isomerase
MILFPAIDLFEGKAVRLFQGDYAQMTVYSENPVEVALDFRQAGATHLHLVDLESAKFGTTSNLDMIRKIVQTAQLSTEVGGGIRSMETVDRYLELGIDRVILGTAAVTDRNFLTQALDKYGKQIAVGVDIKDGYVAIRGWTERSALSANDFFDQMQSLGVSTVICTDISRDGAMQGTNRDLYKELSRRYTINLIASGGVSSLEDIKALRNMDIYGAIIGKAYYTGAVDLTEALEVAK